MSTYLNNRPVQWRLILGTLLLSLTTTSATGSLSSKMVFKTDSNSPTKQPEEISARVLYGGKGKHHGIQSYNGLAPHHGGDVHRGEVPLVYGSYLRSPATPAVSPSPQEMSRLPYVIGSSPSYEIYKMHMGGTGVGEIIGFDKKRDGRFHHSGHSIGYGGMKHLCIGNGFQKGGGLHGGYHKGGGMYGGLHKGNALHSLTGHIKGLGMELESMIGAGLDSFHGKMKGMNGYHNHMKGMNGYHNHMKGMNGYYDHMKGVGMDSMYSMGWKKPSHGYMMKDINLNPFKKFSGMKHGGGMMGHGGGLMMGHGGGIMGGHRGSIMGYGDGMIDHGIIGYNYPYGGYTSHAEPYIHTMGLSQGYGGYNMPMGSHLGGYHYSKFARTV